MKVPDQLLSPKQAARAMRVSESSLKRWCDDGRLSAIRTPGGHRKISLSEILRFSAERGATIVSPEVLGLPPCSAAAEIGLARGAGLLCAALLSGDGRRARQIVYELVRAKHPLNAVCDDVIARAFQQIGDRWACAEANVYQERRACEIMLRILDELRRMLPAPEEARWLAIGGAAEGDGYALPTAMAELVLVECGFDAVSLGDSIPVMSLAAAARELRPKLFWLSVSHLPDEPQFIEGFGELSDACTAVGAALVVGGRALTEGVRQRISFAAHGDNMRHLAGFARALGRPAKRSARSKTAGMCRGGSAPQRTKKGSR